MVDDAEDDTTRLAAPPDWLAVDWGTSRLRAWAVGRDGLVVGRRASSRGMGALTPAEFAPALRRLISDWLDDWPAPIRAVVCGMAGAREGWIEAPYRTTPCAPRADAAARAPSADGLFDALIVPGLRQLDPPDVMRGEETQIAGALADRPRFAGALCLPGTHSKWALAADETVSTFQTFMTGELFQLLSRQSVLRHSTLGDAIVRAELEDAGISTEAFGEGVEAALDAPHQALARFFEIRARTLLRDASAEDSRGRLSGLLVGAEIAAAAPFWRDRRIVLVADGPIERFYRAALAQAGADAVETAPTEAATLSGLIAAAKTLGVATSEHGAPSEDA